MNALAIPPRTPRERIDWNSLFLLLLLIVPAALMSGMLMLWPNARWVAQIQFTTFEIVGSFAILLLAVFLVARYKDQPGSLFTAAGLVGTGILEAFLIAVSPHSNEYAWLHSVAGIYGAVLFFCAILARFRFSLLRDVTIKSKRGKWLFAGAIVVAFTAGISLISFSGKMPGMISNNSFTGLAWALNTIPIALFLSAGIMSFILYRKSGGTDLLIFSAIVIFLFQSSEVFYLASMWGLVWWFWQILRLGIYVSVLSYVMKEYIQTSNSLVKEIAERQRAEIALRQAEYDWRNSFNSLDDAMLIIDRNFTIVRINESALTVLNKTTADVVGKKCPQLFHGLKTACKECPARHSFRSGKVSTAEIHEEATGRTMAVKAAPILNGVNRSGKCVCLMHDITKEIKARKKEQELQQELNMAGRLASIGEVAAGIAHEINNPLTGVIGFAQMLSGMEIPPDMREAIDVIQDGAQRTAGVVEKLLAFARRSKTKRELLDINAVVKSTVDIRAYELRTNNIKLTTAFQPELPKTEANFGQLQQVVLNLVVNAEQAITAAKRPGLLTVSTGSLNDRLIISVSDNGIGIPKENLDKLFDPFFTTKTETGGTGLGLSISYGIIKEHHGKIKVKSKPGEGTTFTLEIPVVAETKHEIKPNDKPVYKNSARPSRIIVIDDELNICRILTRMLTKEGHEVDAVLSAESALEKIQHNNYDLILLDMRMPGMSGIELYDKMKVIDPHFKEKVVFITGDVIGSKYRTFIEDNGATFVTKPFTGNNLIQQVNSTLGGLKHE